MEPTPIPPPDPTSQQNKKNEESDGSSCVLEGGLQKFLCLGSIPREVPPLEIEAITLATWGSAGVTKGGHPRYVGWGRCAPGTKKRIRNHVLGLNSNTVNYRLVQSL